MIKNFIFDFGNVIAEFNPDKLTSPYFPDETIRREIREVVFDRLYWDRLDDGSITDDEVKSGIKSRVLPEYAVKACEAYDGWIANLNPVNGMAEIISELKERGGKIYLLSNISEGFAKTYQKVKWINDILSDFDGLVFSGVIKLVKPKKDIFEFILKRYNLKKEESIFIDDNINNIKGAESVGIKGYLFDGDCVKLKEFLTI